MLIISQIDMILARITLSTFQQCDHCRDCFFGNIKIECVEGCFLRQLRKDIEETSPSFMGLIRTISRYDSINSAGLLVSIQGTSEQKLALVKELADITRFAHYAFCSIMTLSYAYGRLPTNVPQELIEKTCKEFSFEETVEKMGKNNHIWPYLLHASCFSFSKENHVYYRDKLFLIIEVLLRAIGESDKADMSDLLEDVNNFLRNQQKGA